MSTRIPELRWSRREALKAGAAAIAAGPFLHTRRVAAAAPSQRLRLAAVGVGNEGWADLNALASSKGVEVVALCDVDSNFLAIAKSNFTSAKTFVDYRKLLDDAGSEFDAVLIAIPDHMHVAVAAAAMQLGKHVYLQKPLAHNLAELRHLRDAAADSGVITQMGTQCHGMEPYRTAAKMLRAGAIGKVREAHSWITRILPQLYNQRPRRADVPPATLDWKLWQGVAPEKPFVEGALHPFNWRVWRDYGTGMFGDMGCHLLDPIYGGLDLRPPIEAKSAGPKHRRDTFSRDGDVTLTFAGTPYTAEKFTLHWTNGKIAADFARAQLPPGTELPGAGSFLVGEKGVMLLPHHDVMPTFYRDGAPLEMAIDSAGSVDHYHEWADACRGEGKSSTPFSYGAMVTEAALVGQVAGNFPGKALQWNSDELKFDDDAATALVHREYRPDWHPPGM